MSFNLDSIPTLSLKYRRGKYEWVKERNVLYRSHMNNFIEFMLTDFHDLTDNSLKEGVAILPHKHN